MRLSILLLPKPHSSGSRSECIHGVAQMATMQSRGLDVAGQSNINRTTTKIEVRAMNAARVGLFLFMATMAPHAHAKRPASKSTCVTFESCKLVCPTGADVFKGKAKRQGKSTPFLGCFKNGKPHGVVVSWHHNGKLQSKIQHKAGQKDGLSVMWYENGQMEAKETFKDGQRIGLSTLWHKNGQMELQFRSKAGKKNGFLKKWSADGKLVLQVVYKNDRVVEGGNASDNASCEDFKSCKLQCTAGAKAKSGVRRDTGGPFWGCFKDGRPYGPMVSWHKNGKVESKITMISGKQEGLATHWFENGRLRSKVNWKQSKRHGGATEWYENGKKKAESNYKEGVQDGLTTTWFESGQIRQRSMFKNGKLHGETVVWSEDGKSSRKEVWKNGKKVK